MLGTLGISSRATGGESLIVVGNYSQAWNYRQNSDCSYTFFADDDKVLTLSNSIIVQTSVSEAKAEVASLSQTGDCNFNIYDLDENAQVCEDIITKKPGNLFNLEHTKSKQLFRYCRGCILNASDGKDGAVGRDIYPSTYWFNLFKFNFTLSGKVLISLGNEEGTLGIGNNVVGGENLIIVGKYSQAWNYRQNPDCSYTFFTDDGKALTLSNSNNFQTSIDGVKAEVASKDQSGDSNFNIYAVVGSSKQVCEDIIKKKPGAKFNLEHTKSSQLLRYCTNCTTNSTDGKNGTVSTTISPNPYWFDLFEFKFIDEGKVSITVGNEERNLGIGSAKGDENVIIAGNNTQAWNYKQNPDCSYTFFTDDKKVLTLSNTNNLQPIAVKWKAEVASKNQTGDCNFNIYSV